MKTSANDNTRHVQYTQNYMQLGWYGNVRYKTST